MMKAWFHSFDEASETYLETLTDDTDITAAESYYDAIYDDYMDQLDSLNYAIDSLTMQAPAVVQRTDSNPTLSTMSHIINLPTIVREQETKSPTQPLQLEVQNNETVLMNTHDCTCQPSLSQQVKEVMSIELVHLSTCVHDHSTPNCDQSLHDLHIDVKLQPQTSIATITKEQQPDLTHCEPPVINKCSPVTLDQSIDGNDTHMQLSTPAPSSHALHTTSELSFSEPAKHVLLNMDELALSSTDLLEAQTIMHPARDVIFSTPIQLATTRSAGSHLLKAPLKDHLEPKENYTHSQTPRPGRKVKDGTLHITSTPRLAACHILSGVT